MLLSTPSGGAGQRSKEQWIGSEMANLFPLLILVWKNTNTAGVDGYLTISCLLAKAASRARQACLLDLNGYNLLTPDHLKPVFWVGSSKKDLLSMPADIVDVFGFALHLAQSGKKHEQAKPLKGFGGASVLEVVEDHMGDTYRAVYTVKIAGAVYVLHCFQKKSKQGIQTPKHDIDLIQERLRVAQAYGKGD